MTAPEIITVTFDPSLYTSIAGSRASTILSDLQAFDDGITSTSWWATVTHDYCDPQLGCIMQNVAPGPAVAPIATEPPGDGTTTCGAAQPCYTDSAVGGSATLKDYLTGLFAAGTLPAPTNQSLYVFYLPTSVTISVDGQISCQTIGGYHDSVGVNGLDVPYAIVPLCTPEPTTGNTPVLSIEQTATVAASHEIVEATTDPHGGEVPPDSNPNSTQYLGWYLTDTTSQAWALVAGGEVADLCVDVFGLGQDRWTEGNFIYQRIWSNSSAAADHDPCVPIAEGAIYFNAAPPSLLDEQLQLSVGRTARFSVQGFADGPMSWNVFGADSGGTGTVPSTVLTVTPTRAAPGVAGQGSSTPVSITLASEPPMQPGVTAGSPPFEPYVIVSFVMTGGAVMAAHYWPGFVLAPQ